MVENWLKRTESKSLNWVEKNKKSAQEMGKTGSEIELTWPEIKKV